jgi:hypothetical protein
VVETKVDEAENLPLDVSAEVRKLKAIKMWVLLSQKLHSQHRTTIMSIQQTKNLMERVNYPPNSLRKRVEALEIESRSLNKRISLFLEKSRVSEMEIY